MEIKARNVNEALYQGIRLLDSTHLTRVVEGRTGLVKEFKEPVVTIYSKPAERVLWNKARMANPFFHLFESLWMLAGRNDTEFVARLVKRMREYSDDGTVMQGAYGWRWANWFEFDQLETIVNLLRRDPGTRRAVLQMWDPRHDLVKHQSKDIPCNTAVYFKVRDGKLDLSITNRSNDMLWGAYGANAVHMSILLEYVANRADLPVGKMFQYSDSLHVYMDGAGGELYSRLRDALYVREDGAYGLDYDPYISDRSSTRRMTVYPLGAHDSRWRDDLRKFFELWDSQSAMSVSDFDTTWWKDVAFPMWASWVEKSTAITRNIVADDWRIAARHWLDAYLERNSLKRSE